MCDHEGRVYEWGGAHQLHNRNIPEEFVQKEIEKLVPKQVAGLEQIRYVTSSNQGNYALDKEGYVWFWGLRLEGASYNEVPIPEQIQVIDHVKQFRIWSEIMWAREDSGIWKQWGNELFDDTGLNPTDPNSKHLIPHNEVPVASSQMQGFVQIEVSTNRLGEHSLVGLKPDGTVWTWGNNAEGQLGVDGLAKSNEWIQVNIPHNITKIVADGGTVLAITEDGGLYSWGSNFQKKLGDGSTAAKRHEPVLLPEFGADGAEAEPEENQPEEDQSVEDAKQPDTTEPLKPGTHIYLNDVLLGIDAKNIQGNTMVPFRDLFAAFNMNVDWDQQTRTITAKKDDVTLQLTVGSKTAYYNDEERELSVAPLIVDNKTFVNLRFISETLGAKVQYEKLSADVAEVRINYGN